MKKIVSVVCCLVLLLSSALCSCRKNKGDGVSGFYAKTSAVGADVVIDFETESKTYNGEGDLRVRATVGFGHLSEDLGYSEGENDTFKVEYLIIEAPWAADKRPAWEMVSEYEVSFYDEMFDSTEEADGEFYPNFKEEITLTFPEGVEKGYLEIRLYEVVPEREDHQTAELRVYFEYIDGVLTFEP
jgi:hypothetical protein